MGIESMNPGPAKVIRHPFRLHALDQCAEPIEVQWVEWIGPANRKGYAVKDDGFELANLEKVGKGLPGAKSRQPKIIFGERFKPI